MKLTERQKELIDLTVPLDNGHTIVLLNVGGNPEFVGREHNFNIYRIDEDYQIIWQISHTDDQFAGTPDPKASMMERCDFSYLSRDEGFISAVRPIGIEYKLDPDTGIATFYKHLGYHF